MNVFKDNFEIKSSKVLFKADKSYNNDIWIADMKKILNFAQTFKTILLLSPPKRNYACL
jgi:hypothetical protein